MGALDALSAGGASPKVVFLDASDEVLIRRYEQVRRPHPLQGPENTLIGIARERDLLGRLRERADAVIDTSATSVHQLAQEVERVIEGVSAGGLTVSVLSFGFKYGVPLDANHVIDVRFLANPYWIDELRHLTGLDQPVRSYVLGLPNAAEFIDRYADALALALNETEKESGRHVTVAVGCTGGKHRSVAIAEALAEILRGRGKIVRTAHRDLGRE
jgi:UPF0042 nucleotide-binding protein